MKLYAQQGTMEGDKVKDGLIGNFIDGVILSPRDNGIDKLKTKIKSYLTINKEAEIYFDPQLYAAFSPSGEGHKLGFLVDDYSEYFRSCRRAQLMKESAIEDLLQRAIQFQSNINGLNGIIAPNIIIPRSLDSVETVISMNFIRLARRIAKKLNNKQPLFVTLAINREALFKEMEVLEFVNELTALDEPPDGFYILIETRSRESRTEIFNADVIAMWMYLTYALSINGFKVINGYSDLVSPFLSAANGTGAATGWWSNLRTFSKDRFEPSNVRGRLPIQRYLSNKLLNRITFTELDQLRKFDGILNGLKTDDYYPEGEEPSRNKEVLQSWDSIKALINYALPVDGDTLSALAKCLKMVNDAKKMYDEITKSYSLDPKSNAEHLPSLEEGINIFSKLAEIDFG